MLESNYLYFEYSKNNPEELFDSYYKKGIVILPSDASVSNKLTDGNERLIECISTFKYLISKGLSAKDKLIIDIIEEVICILDNTPNINYSAFSQFFMVYNSTYSYYSELPHEDKKAFIFEMLLKYSEERHAMYLSHGYSNAILQVMCDNYSHKRNSKICQNLQLD